MTYLEGNKARLVCNATNDAGAVNQVQITWFYKNNSASIHPVVPDNTRVIIYNVENSTGRQLRSTLFFDPINRTDEGVYTCKASNHPQSNTESSTKVMIKSKLFTGYFSLLANYIANFYIHKIQYSQTISWFPIFEDFLVFAKTLKLLSSNFYQRTDIASLLSQIISMHVCVNASVESIVNKSPVVAIRAGVVGHTRLVATVDYNSYVLI